MKGSIFITGAGGYVGNRFLQSMDRRLYDGIYCLAHKRFTTPPELPVKVVEGDLLEARTYIKYLENCHTVIHLAAVTGKQRPDAYFRINTEGTRILTGECRKAGVEKFLHISTIAAKFTRQEGYPYAQSKKQGEDIVIASGLRYTILRPTMVLGKGAPVLESLRSLAMAPVLPIIGSGKTRVQPVYVDDLIACMHEIVQTNMFRNEVIELGGPDILTMEELLQQLRRHFHRSAARVVHIPAALVMTPLKILEKIFLPLLPVTAGQLASFVNDSCIEPHPAVQAWHGRMKSLEDALDTISR